MPDNKEMELISADSIKDRIYTIRGVQVMLDSDLAGLYGVETRVLNQAVKRNQNRFPNDFCFQLTAEEYADLKSQFVMSNSNLEGLWGGRRKLPLVFTEHGITALSSVLRSDMAVDVGIKIVRAFVAMRHFIIDNAGMFQRISNIETKLLEHDEKINEVFKQFEQPREPRAVMFFKGEISDFNTQYGGLTLSFNKDYHDRFLIVDKSRLYHVGGIAQGCRQACVCHKRNRGRKCFESHFAKPLAGKVIGNGAWILKK